MGTSKSIAWSVAIASLVCAFGPAKTDAQLGPSRLWSLQSISETAELIVVGEVTDVADLGPIHKEETHWRYPLRHMGAKIRILRTFPKDASAKLDRSGFIWLEYKAFDSKKVLIIINGPTFPYLSVRDVYAFGLRSTGSEEKSAWELLDEENNGLLVPSAVKPFRSNGELKSGVEFLLYELSSAFINGSYQDMYNATRFIYTLKQMKQKERLMEILLVNIGQDKDRWAQVALAGYCSLSRNNRPRLDSLPEKMEGQKFRFNLTRTALCQLPQSEFDSLLIREAVKQVQSYPLQMADMLSNNYPRHPTAVSLLLEALKQPTPETAFVASRMIKDAAHPLSIPAANAAAQVFELNEDFSYHYLITGAAKLILQYGNEKQQAQLLKLLREAQKRDRWKFQGIWAGVANWGGKEQHLPFYTTALSDSGLYLDGQFLLRGRRFCDSAVKTLQHRMGVNFGYELKQSESERDKAIEKAKAWLAAKGYDLTKE